MNDPIDPKFKPKYWMCAMTALIPVWMLLAVFFGPEFHTHSWKLLILWVVLSLIFSYPMHLFAKEIKK
jgi:hypothetical protein